MFKTVALAIPAFALLLALTCRADTQLQDKQPPLPYCVVETGQTKCYDDHREISPPRPGQPFYGQDPQFKGHPFDYVLNSNGLTVYDRSTGLTWQRSPDTNGDGVLDKKDKLTWTEAQAWPAKLNAAKFGGFSDWRLPTIKQLYSLFQCRGTDPSGFTGTDTSGLIPFIDTHYFKFAYGDPTNGERIIDSQYASSTLYVNQTMRGVGKLFGVNFADGRIKGYDLQMPGARQKTFFVQCVRGNPLYGKNDFHDNTDGTITDRATGLTWCKTDSARGMNWPDALAWVQKKNQEKYLGKSDWRLPSIKELQSIVDYTRSPDSTHSAAIDPLFDATQITNEDGKVDYPFYWSSTTHGGFGGGSADYIAFGRASGWMSPRPMGGGQGGPQGEQGPKGGTGPFDRPGPSDGPGGPGGPPTANNSSADSASYHYTDVHGAGAQRSDPKSGDPARFPHGHGPQGDVIRIFNYLRLVRGGGAV